MGKFTTIIKQGIWRPGALWRTFCFNILRKHKGSGRICCTPYSLLDLHPSAEISIECDTFFGYKKYRGSRIETSIWMDRNSKLKLNKPDADAEEKRVVIYHGCDIQLFKGAELEIGAPCVMNNGVEIICMDRISIGSNCLISRGVVIRDNDGGHQVLIDGYKATAPVEIGNHVWIGQGAMILKGSKIGDNAIIGAGAIVQGRVKAGSLVMADPSRTFAKNINWSHQ